MAMPKAGVRIVGHELMRAMPDVWRLERMLAHDGQYSRAEIRQTVSRALGCCRGIVRCARCVSPLAGSSTNYPAAHNPANEATIRAGHQNG